MSLEKYVVKCPNCNAKVGKLKLITDQMFACKKCKSPLEFKYNNMLEKKRIDTMQFMLAPFALFLFVISIVSMLMDFADSTQKIIVYVQLLALTAVVVYIIILVNKKINLMKLKQLKLVVPGSKAARR
ncbi:MAG: hypothetical protein ACK5G7_02485 [Erysipelotrichaceae bacterium]